jgi:uncharacterized membrane protein YfbV (UPF0208 family)
VARKLLWPVLVIGLALVVLPFAISLPSKANAGQSMMDNFHSMMQPASVNTTATYFNQTFMPLSPVASGVVSAAREEPAMMAAFAQQFHMSTAQVQALLKTQFPSMGNMLTSLPALTPVFSKVPAGLAWYQPIIQTMQNNVNNYAKIDSLPNFRLFTWFFVVPGALLILISAYGLGAVDLIRRLFHVGHQPVPTH